MLLQEYQYTSHYLFTESVEFIEEYYTNEVLRIEHSSKTELYSNLEEITESFKVLIVELLILILLCY